MKIKIHFNVGVLKNVKPALEVLFKIYQTLNPKPKVYLIYYNKNKNVRLLFSSEIFPAVISISSQTLIHHENWVKLKQTMDLTSMQILDVMKFLNDFLDLLNNQDTTGIVLDVKKQQEVRFIKLNFFQKQEKLHQKHTVCAPKYDALQIKLHHWINGCMSSAVQFFIETEPLLNTMKVFAKMKQSGQNNKKLIIKFDFRQKQYVATIEGGSGPKFEGVTTGSLIYEKNSGNYQFATYSINGEHSKIILQTVKKFKELKMLITQEKELVFVYNKQNIYVCQLKVSEWIRLKSISFNQNGGDVMKIQNQE